MTPVPPPASPCVRVRLIYTDTSGTEAGSRFYLGYAGAAPSAGNCITLATDIATAWNDHLASLPSNNWTLTEVDVLDITTDLGLSGAATVSFEASGGTVPLAKMSAINVEYNIARRYRGGKPRMFLPGGTQANMTDEGRWTDGFIGDVNTGMAAFFSQIEALEIGTMGALTHVNLSYYAGFKNITNSSGRERAVPTYRATALLDVVQGYACKARIGSQRRRLASTTP